MISAIKGKVPSNTKYTRDLFMEKIIERRIKLQAPEVIDYDLKIYKNNEVNLIIKFEYKNEELYELAHNVTGLQYQENIDKLIKQAKWAYNFFIYQGGKNLFETKRYILDQIENRANYSDAGYDYKNTIKDLNYIEEVIKEYRNKKCETSLLRYVMDKMVAK